jgi:hypothetical protein
MQSSQLGGFLLGCLKRNSVEEIHGSEGGGGVEAERGSRSS